MEDFNQREINPAENCAPYFHSVPTYVTCTFLESSFKGYWTNKGFVEDISLKELSLELRDDYFSIQESLVIYNLVELSMDFRFPDGLHQVVLTDIITWNKRVRKKKKAVCTLEYV